MPQFNESKFIPLLTGKADNVTLQFIPISFCNFFKGDNMILRRIIFRPVLGIALVISLCLAVLAGRSDANVLKLILPAILAKKQTPSGRSWQSPQLIETETGDTGIPDVAFDGAGNALAVWKQDNSTTYRIMANRYMVGSGWGTTDPIGSASDNVWILPQVAMDGAGNALVVWDQDEDDGILSIMANRYEAGSGWGTAEPIETFEDHAFNARIAMDGAGNAFAVWEQWGGITHSIIANCYMVGSGWGTAEPIKNYAGWTLSPQVAFDEAGNAIAVWQQGDATTDSIWANRYTPSGGWGTAEPIETDAGGAEAPEIAVDGAGNAIAVWRQDDGNGIYSIMTNRYVAGSGWSTAEAIETGAGNAGDAGNPQVAFDGAGNALVVWRQDDDTGSSIMSNRYVAGGGWGTAQVIDSYAGTASYPQVAFDGVGNAVAIWYQYNGTYSIWANRYEASGGWGTAEGIETYTEWMTFPQLAVDGAGNALVVWQQRDGTRYNIWAAWYK